MTIGLTIDEEKKYERMNPIRKIWFKNLSFGYQENNQILDDVTFEFPPNAITHLKGDSGVGTSTILKLLGGLLQPNSGSLLINEDDITKFSFEEMIPYRLNIGFSFDMGGLLSNKTVYDNLMLPIAYHNLLEEKEAAERIELLMQAFGIQLQRNLRPADISGGQRKATCVARALALYPELVVLDQPSVGLDKQTMRRLVRLLHIGRDQKWLKHVIVTSQDQEFLSLLECQTFVLHKRKIISHTDFEKGVLVV